jgi:hypothetical protein
MLPHLAIFFIRNNERISMNEDTKKILKRSEEAMSSLSERERDQLPERDFAFPKERKEPLVDAEHVRNAIARFDQVQDVSDAERDEAWRRIKQAAKKYKVEIDERDWRDLFK